MTEKDEVLRRLAAGETAATISTAMCITTRRVYQIRGEQKRRPITGELVEEVRRRFGRGDSQRLIASDLKMSRKTVAGLVEDLDILPKPAKAGKLSNDEVAHILSRHRAGREVGTIAKEMQIEPTAVRQVIKRNVRPNDPEDIIMMTIRAEMDRRGMIVSQLAIEMGEPPTREYLYAIFRGDQSPTTPIASRILKFMGIRFVAGP